MKAKKPEILSTDIQPLTKELAQKWANMDELPGDRDLNKRRLAHLRNVITNTTTAPFIWSCAKIGKKTYRVNGKHTSWLFTEGKLAIPKGAVVFLTEFKCSSHKAMRDLYMSYDDPKIGKTLRDCDKMYSQSNPHLSEISISVVQPITSGIVASKCNRPENVGAVDFATRGSYMLSNVEFYLWYYKDVMLSKGIRHMLRPAAIMAAYRMWKKEPEKALEFWRDVSSGYGGPGDPQRTLYEYLGILKPRGAKVYDPKDKSIVQYSKCVFAWNAWLGGRRLSTLRPPKTDVVEGKRDFLIPDILGVA